MGERQEPNGIYINLAEWQTRRLDELVSTTGLSREQLASEILDFILSGDASIIELISRFAAPTGGNGCPEECADIGQAWKFVDGECPEPCDEDVLADLDRLARGDARRHAM